MALIDTLLVNRSYAWLWFGQSVSFLGDFVFDTTLVLWVGIVLLRGNPYAPAAMRDADRAAAAESESVADPAHLR